MIKDDIQKKKRKEKKLLRLYIYTSMSFIYRLERKSLHHHHSTASYVLIPEFDSDRAENENCAMDNFHEHPHCWSESRYNHRERRVSV
jgi:hypothetical protein